MAKHTLDTLPMNDAAAALLVAQDLDAAGQFNYEAAQMLRMSMVTEDQATAYEEGMAKLDLTPTPKVTKAPRRARS